MSKLKEWMSENSELKSILIISVFISLLVFILSLLPYLACIYLGTIPMIMALAVDAGLLVGTIAFSDHIGVFD